MTNKVVFLIRDCHKCSRAFTIHEEHYFEGIDPMGIARRLFADKTDYECEHCHQKDKYALNNVTWFHIKVSFR